MRIIRAVLVSVAVAGLMVGLTATPASAAGIKAFCYWAANVDDCLSSGDRVSVGSTYTDVDDRLCVADIRADGHSGVVKVWQTFAPWNTTTVWATGGVGTSNCGSLANKTENASYKMAACLGEWAADASLRRIIDCGPSVQIWI